MGWGLTGNIEDAYRAHLFTYEPGDEIDTARRSPV